MRDNANAQTEEDIQVKDDAPPDTNLNKLREACGLTPVFPVWRTIGIGGIDAAEFTRRLKAGDIEVTSYAVNLNLMWRPGFKTSPEPRPVKFAKVQVKDIGFTEMPTTRQLLNPERLKRYKLGLCLPKDGPTIRLADTNQPHDTGYWVGMEPIVGSCEVPRVWHVYRNADGVRCLYAFYAHPDGQWGLGSEVVFRLCE